MVKLADKAKDVLKQAAALLTPRWYPLRNVPEQMGYVHSPHRFNVVPAGRRSGKTERAKRKIARKALDTTNITHDEAPRFFAGAPTRLQAKQIWWDDLKALTKPWWAQRPSESELSIKLITGSIIVVFGMDRPQRIEGQPWDGGVLDEFADMDEKAWEENVRPVMSDRNGWCDLIGVPEGRNHYYKLYKRALALMKRDGAASEWGAFTWFSSAVLSPKEIEAARADMDLLTFQQEYEADFLNFEGRAYYSYTEANARPCRHLYNPYAPLIFMLDFNVKPGVAAVGQWVQPDITQEAWFAVFGEVYIKDNSNTELVCRRLLLDWGGMHEGMVEVYGDATGGNRGSAKLKGSDWDIAKVMLKEGDPERGLRGFGGRVTFYVPLQNGPERSRVNAVNTLLCNTQGKRRMFVDEVTAPHVVTDFEGVPLVEGGSGEIDKEKNKALTHISDGIGYYVVYRFPVATPGSRTIKLRP